MQQCCCTVTAPHPVLVHTHTCGCAGVDTSVAVDFNSCRQRVKLDTMATPCPQNLTLCVCLHSRSVFLLFNIALGAYILGTITLLVVKNDERTGRYRDLSSNLKTYRCACVGEGWGWCDCTLWRPAHLGLPSNS